MSWLGQIDLTSQKHHECKPLILGVYLVRDERSESLDACPQLDLYISLAMMPFEVFGFIAKVRTSKRIFSSPFAPWNIRQFGGINGDGEPT